MNSKQEKQQDLDEARFERTMAELRRYIRGNSLYCTECRRSAEEHLPSGKCLFGPGMKNVPAVHTITLSLSEV